MNRKHREETKEMIKRNELGELLNRGFEAFRANKKPAFMLVGAIVVVGVGLFGLKIHRMQQIKGFNEAYVQAQKSLKKQQEYSALIQEYESLPAHHLARLKLADYHVENNDLDAALKVLTDGLKETGADLLTTQLVLKAADIQKTQKKYTEAAMFLGQKSGRVLPEFRGFVKLLQGDLFALAGQKNKARVIYTTLSDEKPDAEETTQVSYDPQVVELARQKLLAMEIDG